MDKSKVLVVFGTRPECIKLWPVVEELRGDRRFVTRVCNTGQHREMVASAMQTLGFRADFNLDLMTPNQTLADIVSRLLGALDGLIRTEKPDWVLVQGDTSTTIAAALAAFYQKVAIGHIEAGLRSYNLNSPFPEEANRVLVGHLASLSFAPTQRNVQALMREGIPESRIRLTGNTVVEAVQTISKRAARLKWSELGLNAPGLVSDLEHEGRQVVLVTQHRRENHGQPLAGILRAIKQLALEFAETLFVFPVHPNPAVKQEVIQALSGLSNVHLTEPLDYPALIRIAARSSLIISDSGGLQEEGPALGKKVIVTRDTTERQEAVEAGFTVLTGSDTALICNLARQELHHPGQRAAAELFGDGKASKRIADAIAGPKNSIK